MHVPKIRIIFLSILFLVCALFVYAFDKDSETPIAKPLQQVPQQIGSWQAVSSQSMGDEVESVLGVDDYILRNYRNAHGVQINLYVSYFTYTDRNKGYHSPLNCMPGSGWNIAETNPVSLSLPAADQKATVNQLILQKGRQKQISLYWYQCRGRILHNEYLERIYRVIDSIFKNRTDGAFIRLIATNSDQDLQEDMAMLRGFATQIIPVLRKYLPE